MKIAVSATGKDLDSQIDPRFGRCAYFVIVNTDDMSFEAFDNENISLGGGAGIQAAQFVASKGAKVVITGNCGPNAMRTLSAAGIEVVVGQNGTVREVVEAYKRGRLSPTSEPNVTDHYGMGAGGASTQWPAGGGGGRGCWGRGMGMGRGRGMGRGMGMGQGMGYARGGDFGGSELDELKAQARELKRQIEAIESRIRDLETS